MDERRRFTRILFSNPATLMTASGDYNCRVLDLSLKGALITLPVSYVPLQGEAANLKFHLPDSDVLISMEVEVRHVEADYLGLHCGQIDLESVTHLKRLIELNIGDNTVLNREIEQLAYIRA
jgi:hypothetical protein